MHALFSTHNFAHIKMFTWWSTLENVKIKTRMSRKKLRRWIKPLEVNQKCILWNLFPFSTNMFANIPFISANIGLASMCMFVCLCSSCSSSYINCTADAGKKNEKKNKHFHLYEQTKARLCFVETEFHKNDWILLNLCFPSQLSLG